MSGVTAQQNRVASAAPAAVAPRSYKTSLRPRLRGFREETGGAAQGSVWLVRIIEAGQSLNGPIYTEECLREGVAIFEGKPVYLYSFNDEPTADDAGHLPDKVAEAETRGLVGRQVGSLNGVHYNEQAKALDAHLHVYDGKLREKLLGAYKLGDIGEGGARDVFGLSIDAVGDADPSTGEVMRFTSATSVDVVNTPAAGGRIRRLIEKLQTESKSTEANSTEANSTEPKLGESLKKKPKEEMVTTTTVTQLTENAATFAGKLKILADQLSAAPDGEAATVLGAIKEAVDAMLTEMSGEAVEEESDEDDDKIKDPEEGEVTQATNDEFARMEAGLTEAIKDPTTTPEVRAKLVEALGREPDEDERDRELRAMREQLREQAIGFEFTRLTESGEDAIKLVDSDLVLSLIDRSKVKLNEKNQVRGLKEQIEAVLEAKPYLRVTEAAAEVVAEVVAAKPPVAPVVDETPQSAAEKAMHAMNENAPAPVATAAAPARVTEVVAPAAAPEPLAAGVRLTEQVRNPVVPLNGMSAQRRAYLNKRMQSGDVAAASEIRRATGHRH